MYTDTHTETPSITDRMGLNTGIKDIAIVLCGCIQMCSLHFTYIFVSYVPVVTDIGNRGGIEKFIPFTSWQGSLWDLSIVGETVLISMEIWDVYWTVDTMTIDAMIVLVSCV